MYNRRHICNNCGGVGHYTKDCAFPINSNGIILYRVDSISQELEYLMVRRRNTIGFVEFMRGKYVNNDYNYILQLFNVMTNYEIDILKNKSFDELWEYLWMDKKFDTSSERIQSTYSNALRKFTKMKSGYSLDNKMVDIVYFIGKRTTSYEEQEWGFPKGRRNYNESNFNAALREFQEETNITSSDIQIVNKSKCFHEQYKSYDNVEYKNIYYIGKYTGDGNILIDDNKKEQCTEISNIAFFNLENLYKRLRNYDSEKVKLIGIVNNYIKNML